MSEVFILFIETQRAVLPTVEVFSEYEDALARLNDQFRSESELKNKPSDDDMEWGGRCSQSLDNDVRIIAEGWYRFDECLCKCSIYEVQLNLPQKKEG